MKPINCFEKLIKDSHVLDINTSVEMDQRILHDTLKAQQELKQTKLAGTQPDIRRIIMKSSITKVAAAAVIIIALTLSIHLWNKSTPSAYAFEQTVEAMQGKHSFHIQTYWGSPDWRKDEYWAEFDENGKVFHSRQEEWNGRDEKDGPRQVTVWEDNIRDRYYPEAGIELITRIGNTEPELEEFDPETTVQEVYGQVANGEATINIQEPAMDDGLITITVTHAGGNAKRILLVDPETKFVIRSDSYWCDSEEEHEYSFGIEVLGYNQSFDANIFNLNLPDDIITIDQVSQEVGMAQDDMSDEEIASKIVRKALEAWAAGDYAQAGILFGGAPPELLTKRYWYLRPVKRISIGQLRAIEYRKPWFEVPCTYDIEYNNRIERLVWKMNALTVDGQPGRWYVSIERNP